MKPGFIALTTLLFTGAIAAQTAQANHQSLEHKEFPLYTTVTQDRPQIIFTGNRYVESIDVNWRGARGTATMGRVYADGIEVWSGLIPAYDPTFRGTIRRVVNSIEIRVDSGEAYVNWLKAYMDFQSGPSASPRGSHCANNDCRLEMIGSMKDADDLARQTVRTIRSLQEKFDGSTRNLLPLKKAAARVFAVSKGNGSYHLGETMSAVLALEAEFAKQEDFIQSLIEWEITYEEGLTLMTIRERYKALFGKSTY